jgi:hypothetical protein
VTIGSDFNTTYVSDVRRALCPFTMSESDEVFVELILTGTTDDWRTATVARRPL